MKKSEIYSTPRILALSWSPSEPTTYCCVLDCSWANVPLSCHGAIFLWPNYYCTHYVCTYKFMVCFIRSELASELLGRDIYFLLWYWLLFIYHVFVISKIPLNDDGGHPSNSSTHSFTFQLSLRLWHRQGGRQRFRDTSPNDIGVKTCRTRWLPCSWNAYKWLDTYIRTYRTYSKVPGHIWRKYDGSSAQKQPFINTGKTNLPLKVFSP